MRTSLVFLWVSLSSFAVEVDFDRGPPPRWYLKGSCEKLKKSRADLAQWAGVDAPDVECTKEGSSEERLEISDVLPPLLKDNYGQYDVCNGPNCFNTALFLSQIVRTRRGTTNDEFLFWLHSPLCTKLEKGAPKKPGDIVSVVRGAKLDAVHIDHTFIYINEDIGVQKPGLTNGTAIVLAPADYLWGAKQNKAIGNGQFIAEECRDVAEEPPAKCFKWSSYYRCEKLSTYLQKQPTEVQKKFADMNQYLDIFEGRLSTATVKGPEGEKLLSRESLIKEFCLLPNFYELGSCGNKVLDESIEKKRGSFDYQVHKIYQ